MDWLRDLEFTDGWGAAAIVIAILGGILALVTRRKVNRQAEGFQSSIHELIDIMRDRRPTGETGLASATSPTSRAPSAKREWLIENPSKNKFVLRNIGPGDVTGVTVDLDRINCIVKNNPVGVTLAEGEGYAMGLVGTFQTGGPPDQLWVRTDEEPDWVAVPLARWH